ncbi:hypothetical protein BD560DRAFT_73389 [Blakeslea trispora]|nr:hypothetical protein BD560DRAFT_73389 [Blakeslea trispora]
MTLNIQNEQGEIIVGVLSKKFDNNKLALLIHGDQGHKDSFYQAQLAEKLPLNSFRFDLHGRGQSEGHADYGDIARDVDDISAVAKYFEEQGYEIYAIVAYGRGSLSGLKYATSCDKPLSHYINIAAPYTNKDTRLGLDENHEWRVYRDSQWISIGVTKEQIQAFNSWENTHVIRMPKTTCVHTIHGIDDQVCLFYYLCWREKS